MKIIKEINLNEFEPWCGAVVLYNMMTEEERDYIDDILSDMYPEGLTYTELNDILWFDDDMIAEMLGYVSFDHMWEERRG